MNFFDIEKYVDLLISKTNSEEKEEVLKMSLESKIDFIAGNPVRYERKTYKLNTGVISLEEWECLHDRIH